MNLIYFNFNQLNSDIMNSILYMINIKLNNYGK